MRGTIYVNKTIKTGRFRGIMWMGVTWTTGPNFGGRESHNIRDVWDTDTEPHPVESPRHRSGSGITDRVVNCESPRSSPKSERKLRLVGTSSLVHSRSRSPYSKGFLSCECLVGGQSWTWQVGGFREVGSEGTHQPSETPKRGSHVEGLGLSTTLRSEKGLGLSVVAPRSEKGKRRCTKGRV